MVGGPARIHVVLVLACVLGLNTADRAAVGAAGSQLARVVASLTGGFVAADERGRSYGFRPRGR